MERGESVNGESSRKRQAGVASGGEMVSGSVGKRSRVY